VHHGFPVVLGAGERLLGETSDKKALRLVDTQTVGGDVVFLTYEVVRGPSGGRTSPAFRWKLGCPHASDEERRSE
jgi:hypothetical protein